MELNLLQRFNMENVQKLGKTIHMQILKIKGHIGSFNVFYCQEHQTFMPSKALDLIRDIRRKHFQIRADFYCCGTKIK